MIQTIRNRKKLGLLCLFMVIFMTQWSWSQIYPVQVNSNVLPPYLSSVSKYSTTTDQKYLVNIFTSDLSVVNRQVKLKLYIQGNGINAQSTPVVVGATPLFINGGESVQLNNIDLAPYFELQNLQGINPLQYGGVLPQGNYNFCIEVYDFVTNQPISQKSCTFFYFIYNEPPLLNLPVNHDVIHFQDPQNIIFTWTPRHINATNIEYEFTLIELLDNQAPSNYAFIVGAPVWQETINNTILNYNFNFPQLTAGKKYAWRVKAVSQPGFGEDAVFNNNGYSEIYDFIYAGNCNAPEFVIAQSTSARQAKIMWQSNFNHLSYVVQYRKIGTQEWFNAPVSNGEATLHDLEPSATYEFQVGGTCLGGLTTFSAITQFTQPDQNVAVINCGIAPAIDLTNVTLYDQELAQDMVFMASDFAVHINDIQGIGTYTGTGWTRLPYLSNIKVAVEFTNIKLNSELQLVDGEVKAQYDPTWGNIVSVNDVIDVIDDALDYLQESNDVHVHEVDFVIGDVSNIQVSNGQILITNPETGIVGAIFDFDQGENTTIQDSNGTIYSVDPNGNVSLQGQGIGIPNNSNTENLNSQGQVTALSNVGAKVIFSRNSQSVAFDDTSASYTTAPAKLAQEYKTIKDGSGNDYPFYYKGVINNEDGKVSYDYVTAQITITDTLIKAKDIVFNSNGIKVTAIDSVTVGNVTTKTLKIPAFTTVGEDQLLALVKTDTLQQKVVGAMMVVPIKNTGTVNISLVPVNGATITSTEIEEIKSLYRGAGVELNITLLSAYTDAITTLECGTSGFLANYTNEQNAFIDRYKATTSIDSQQYYVFLTKDIAPSRPLSGFMPLHRQFGFIFTGQNGSGEIKQTSGSGLATVIAHEVGHGVFELRHPWETYDYNSETYATNWLMDYASGTKLPYRHWQQISHPKTKLYLFQSDESGEFNDKYALTPNYKFIFVEGTRTLNLKKVDECPFGTLPGFILNYGTETEKRYSWNSIVEKYENDDVPNDFYELSSIKDRLDATVEFKVFYNLNLGCRGGSSIVFKYNEANSIWNSNDKANALFLLINSNIAKGKRIACKANAEESETQKKEWKIVPIDCSILNIAALDGKINAIKLAVDDDSKSLSQIEAVLEANISSCVLEKLPYATRIKLLDRFIVDNISDDSVWEINNDYYGGRDYYFIKDVILTIPQDERKDLLLKIKADNFKWIKTLYVTSKSLLGFDNDVNMTQTSEIFLTLSEWVIENYDQLGIQPTVKQAFIFNGQPAISSYYPGKQAYVLGKDNFDITLETSYNTEVNIIKTDLGFLDSGKVRFYNKYRVTDLSPRIYDANNPPPPSSYYSYFEYDENFNPYEPITIICGIENQFGLETKKEIIVPALAALAYQAVINEEGKQENLRQFGNAVMITTGVLAAPFSGGTSLAAVAATISTVGIAVGSIDAYMTSVASADVNFKNSSFYKSWDTTYTAFSIIDGGAGVANLANTGYNLFKLSNLAKSYNTFDNLAVTATGFNNTVFSQRLNSLRNALTTGIVDVNYLKRATTFSNYISRINRVFKKTIVASALLINLSGNASEPFLSISNNANRIEAVINVANKLEQITPTEIAVITSKADDIANALRAESTIAIKANPNALAVDGKLAVIEAGQYNIIATQINNQLIATVVKLTPYGEQFYQYTQDIDNENTNPNKCNFCPNKIGNTKNSQLCQKLEQLGANTQNTQGVQKLCDQGINLAILDKVLSYSIPKQKLFVTDFEEISVAGMEILKDKVYLIDYWKDNGDYFKTVKPYHASNHIAWTQSASVMRNMGARQTELVNAVDHLLHPDIHFKESLEHPNGLTDNEFDPKIVGSGNTSLGNTIIRFNRKAFNGNSIENDENTYRAYLNSLHPFLRRHVEYMDFIRKDCLSNGSLFEKLYGGKISRQKINVAQRPGIHTEVQILNEFIKNKTINNVQDIQALNIMIVVKIKAKNFENDDEHQHMSTCPHCFYITQGVNFINNK